MLRERLHDRLADARLIVRGRACELPARHALVHILPHGGSVAVEAGEGHTSGEARMVRILAGPREAAERLARKPVRVSKAKQGTDLLGQGRLEVVALPAHDKDALVKGPRHHDQEESERRAEHGRLREHDQGTLEA